MTDSQVPSIVQKLLGDDGKNIRKYFHTPKAPSRDERNWGRVSRIDDDEKAKKWISEFAKKVENRILDHDEPWVTLVALFGLFGNQYDINSPKRLDALNELLSKIFLSRHGSPEPPQFDNLEGVHLEVKLPEILRYREYVHKTIFKDGAYHLYLDRKRTLETKLEKPKASFEGNTNLDVLISGTAGNRNIHLFIEAKLMSDISKDVTYVPVRNQIARTIDCAIDLMTKGGNDLDGLRDFWFILLTPGIFRTDWYGGPVDSPFRSFVPECSRLYCYKMVDYLDASVLRRDLPHWEGVLTNDDWMLISGHIGWLAYEDIVAIVTSDGLMDTKEMGDYRAFFHERSMV